MSKSPFFINQHFLSPLKCEKYIQDISPLTDDSAFKLSEDNLNELVHTYISSIEHDVEDYYDVLVRGYEQPTLFLYENSGYDDGCDGFSYVNKKWLKTKDRDLSCTLFLCDYQDNVNFDNRFEIYGGKIEYPQHNFGFNHQRGTLIIHPSTPHFIHHMNPVTIGRCYIIKWYIKTELPFIYDQKLFPGDYKTWFKEIV